MKKLLIATILASTLVSGAVFAGDQLKNGPTKLNLNLNNFSTAFFSLEPILNHQVVTLTRTYHDGWLIKSVVELSKPFPNSELPKTLEKAANIANNLSHSDSALWRVSGNNLELVGSDNVLIEGYDVTSRNDTLTFTLYGAPIDKVEWTPNEL